MRGGCRTSQPHPRPNPVAFVCGSPQGTPGSPEAPPPPPAGGQEPRQALASAAWSVALRSLTPPDGRGWRARSLWQREVLRLAGLKSTSGRLLQGGGPHLCMTILGQWMTSSILGLGFLRHQVSVAIPICAL